MRFEAPGDRSPARHGPLRSARRRFGVLALVAGALLVACGSSATPPRSPFDDGGAAPTARPGVTSYPPPFLPPSMTPSAGAPTAPPGAPQSPVAGDPEAAAGAAIEALANRMSVTAPRLTLLKTEQVDWPNACLGVSLPGLTCAQVVTPGYRVTLRYDTGSTHEVRTGGGGVATWVAQATLSATVREGERAGAPLALADAGGRPIAVLLASGTQRLSVPVGALKAGDRVTLGVDDTRDGGALRAVWIARE
jgi:hypothetical protein